MNYGYYHPYVSAAQRRSRAAKVMKSLRKQGVDVRPIEPFQTRGIARTFWGRAWCDHLESYSDYANRLPRGRTYVRNGSVCHLGIREGEVCALVVGSELYEVSVQVKKLPAKRWNTVRKRCAGQIGSLIELLEGRLSEGAMAVVTDRQAGLFPSPREIALDCTCPDWATMCKHVAAVLYGVGVRLDDSPELLFLLRGVDHGDLIASEAGALAAATDRKGGGRRRLAEDDVSAIFGIDLAGEEESEVEAEAPPPTGEDVRALRSRLELTQAQLAGILGVSTNTIGNWERRDGPLRLQRRTQVAWNRSRKLSRCAARRRLDEERTEG